MIRYSITNLKDEKEIKNKLNPVFTNETT